MPTGKVTVHTDGASRGNPGPAAASFVISHDQVPILEYAEAIGKATNNFAEYTAMIRALECCQRLGINQLRLHSDSELMVKQMRGEYKVKHPDIIPLYDQAKKLAAGFASLEFVHVPRAENAVADRLGNDALNGKPHPLPPLDGFTFARVEEPDDKPAADAAQIAILQRAEEAWASGDSTVKPADIWAELQQSLQREGRLKTASKSRAGGKSRRRKS